MCVQVIRLRCSRAQPISDRLLINTKHKCVGERLNSSHRSHDPPANAGGVILSCAFGAAPLVRAVPPSPHPEVPSMHIYQATVTRCRGLLCARGRPGMACVYCCNTKRQVSVVQLHGGHNHLEITPCACWWARTRVASSSTGLGSSSSSISRMVSHLPLVHAPADHSTRITSPSRDYTPSRARPLR